MSRRQQQPPAPAGVPTHPLPEEGGSFIWDGQSLTPGEEAPAAAPLALPAASPAPSATTEE